jgi:peptide/nickel transport system substrate-binding protein
MRKLWVPVIILLVCAFVLAGCGTDATSSVAKPAATTTAATVITSGAPASAAPTAPATTATVKPATSVPAVTSASPTAAGQARYGGNLIWIEPTPPGTPLGTPWESNFPSGAMQLGFEALLKEQLNGTLLPRLATSWEVDSNLQAPTMTFTLRKGVKFHDGTDFNAKAVKFNFDKLKAAALFSSPRYYKSVDVIDDYTIKILFTEWRNSLQPAFAQNMSYMASPTAFEKNGIDWMRWNIVGTGAFKQTDFKRDVSVTFVKNENYYETGKPYMNGAQYVFVADELTRSALFKSGGADVLNTSTNGRVAAEFAALGFPIVTQPVGTDSLFPDSANADSPWANIKVRQAVEYAIDKEAIARTFGYGFWKAAYQLPNPDSLAYVSTITARKYDVAKAKQLLTEAGFPSGFKSKIIAQNTVNKDIIVALQSYLSKIGIQVELEFPEPAKFVEFQQGTWKNALIYYSVGQSPNYNQTFGFSFASPRTNYKSLKNPDKWLDLMNETNGAPAMDPKIMQKLVQTLYDDTTVIPINYSTAMWVVKDSVQDSGIGTRGGTPYWNAENAWKSK